AGGAAARGGHVACLSRRGCGRRPAGRSPGAASRKRPRKTAATMKELGAAEATPSSKAFRHGPTLPLGRPSSTIGAGGLNGRVRNGNGCGPSAIRTGKGESLKERLHLESCTGQVYVLSEARSSPRPISTGWLRTLLSLHLR